MQGDGTVGLLQSVDGSTLTLQSRDGQTVKVTTTASTQVIKVVNGTEQPSSLSALTVGQLTIVRGTTGTDGTVAATAISQGGATGTNYQLFPGDRVYIKPDPLILIDNTLAKVLAPIERLLGFTLLANTTVQSFRRNGGTGNNGFAFIAPLR